MINRDRDSLEGAATIAFEAAARPMIRDFKRYRPGTFHDASRAMEAVGCGYAAAMLLQANWPLPRHRSLVALKTA